MLKFYKKHECRVLLGFNLMAGVANMYFGESGLSVVTGCLAFFVSGMCATLVMTEE